MRYSALSLKDLVCLCAGPPDDNAWEEFVSRVRKPIGLTIMRTASLWGEPSRSVVEDLAQITYIRLWEDGCRLLRDFAIQHPEAIWGYIKKTAANTTHDYFKHRHSQSSGGDKPHVSTSDIDLRGGMDQFAAEWDAQELCIRYPSGLHNHSRAISRASGARPFGTSSAP
jgi:hypothetical protein